MKLDTHFSTTDLSFLIAGLVGFVGSIILFSKDRYKAAVVLLTLAGLTWRLWMAFIDPFLHSWDEQFHALVAKNMTTDFFHPTLVKNALLPLDPKNWAYTDNWLHKPPFFMWLMACSIKIFGPTVWAVRIPSVLLSALMIPAVYRIGTMIARPRIGYYAALLTGTSFILIHIVSGYLNTDHNDVVFIAIVCFGWWTWLEYVESPKTKWLLLTSFFVACAVLTKWLPGLIVVGTAGLYWLLNQRREPQKLLSVIYIFMLALIPIAVWFGYTSYQWPEHWAATQEHYKLHFRDAFGHSGPWYFHFAEWFRQHPVWQTALLFFGIAFALFNTRRHSVVLPLLVTSVIVFLFYSFVVTKMPLFCAITYPLLYVFAAVGLDAVITQLASYRISIKTQITAVVIAGFAFMNLDIGRIEFFHTNRTKGELYRNTRLHNAPLLQQLKDRFPSGTIVFNCPQWNAIACMYYTDYTCYDILPDAHLLKAAQEQHRKVIVLDNGQLPDYITSNPQITILANDLVRNGF